MDEETFRYARHEHRNDTPTATYGTPNRLILPRHLGAWPVCAMVSSDLVLANMNAFAADHRTGQNAPVDMWGSTLMPAFWIPIT